MPTTDELAATDWMGKRGIAPLFCFLLFPPDFWFRLADLR